MSTTAEPNSRCRSLSRSRICACTVTSSAVVGSSAISSFGVVDQADGDHRPLAHAAGELVRVAAGAAVAGCGMPTRSSISTARFMRDGLRHLVVGLVRLGDLVADAVEGVQRGLRVLEDHRHRAAADLLELARRGADDLLPVEHDAAGHHRALGVVQAEHGHAGDGLARARLPHDGQRAAEAGVVAEVADGVDQALVAGEPDGQVADLRGPRRRRRRLRRRRSGRSARWAGCS